MPSSPNQQGALACPRCEDGELQEHRLEEWEVKVCRACGGLWLGPDTFRKAAKKLPPPGIDPKAAEADRRAVWEESPLGCPACRKPMRKSQYSYSSGILIDRCEVCGGIWLDRGELGKIRAFVNQDVPKETLLMAQLQAETLRKRMETRERREEILSGLGQGSTGGTGAGWHEVLSFLRDLIFGLGR